VTTVSKMSELDIVLQELHAAAKAIIGAADGLWVFYSKSAEPPDADAPPEAKPETPKPVPITLEKVRGVLADKSRAGHTEAVRELLAKHGGGKLSEISPDRYPELLKDAEGLE